MQLLRLTAIFQKMDTSMGLSSIASLSLGLSMSMTGTPGGAMLMRNLGVSAGGPLKRPQQRLGAGALYRSNNFLSQSPRPRSPATKSGQPSAASSRENVNRLNEDGEVPRTKEKSEGQTAVDGVDSQSKPPKSPPLVDGIRQEVSVDVEPTPVDCRLPASTVSDSIVLVVPDLATTTTATVTRPSSLRPASVSDGPMNGGPVSCILLSADDTDLTDNASQPTISISLDSYTDVGETLTKRGFKAPRDQDQGDNNTECLNTLNTKHYPVLQL